MKMKTKMMLFFAAIFTAMVPIRAADFAAALAAGRISATFQGTGGSSGDSIEVVVAKTSKGEPDLELTIAPGTRLGNASDSAQSMVIAAIEGQVRGESSYSPSSVIRVEDTPKTYVLDAYCTDFEKDNPSLQSKFKLEKADPVLACILTEAANLSPQAKQAAVWIHTDNVSYDHLKAKFPVTRFDWDAAAAVAKKCSAKGRATEGR
jgi:hypothetical protein